MSLDGDYASMSQLGESVRGDRMLTMHRVAHCTIGLVAVRYVCRTTCIYQKLEVESSAALPENDQGIDMLVDRDGS